ncbi:hypothetical protein [Sulfitobacter geojensis]|uniref:Uncharacterized protein n=1 Tax=Sulfitobacter geojensis TaxID=1342299 RepID=A0AAE2W0G4_9RHOB|nr:hypothetical protein [Sulfitobacter geojensis]MBM1690942.1 hypothetical protein [Sulfitobacter geojensis]MBM1695008.1 hypothetical protein [Sulfitobacter geojensis]MBM1707081.1 hypothetical protein [Sulfitobacter geojensis]MBM1711231.1 hypothetical protein [Sulfitobacter geojensis]MBM1715206.1 hypothetical protein [Sulfitobacter geojensis]
MSIANWIALVVPAIGLLGAAALYSFQKSVDRGDAIIAEKRKAYKALLNSLFEHAEHRTEETRKTYDKSKIEMLLVAPDGVVKELVCVQEMATMDMNATGPLDVHSAVVTLILEMRKDCFDGSALNSDQLEYVVPIGKPTPLTGTIEGHFEPS